MKQEEDDMAGHGCPGSQTIDLRKPEEAAAGQPGGGDGSVQSQLRQWPIQLHLVQPNAPYFKAADVLLTADCVAYAMGGFHPGFLKGKALAIACPKLDDGQDSYVEKVRAWIDEAQINTLTVVIMQVPCCGGLLQMATRAAQSAGRKIPIKSVVVSLQGEVLREEWVQC
jgi:hypothetical protein